MRSTLIFSVTVFFCIAVVAQNSLPVPLNIKRAYDKGTRSTDGRPGKNYWQNHAVYRIAVDFDPETRLLKGTVQATYTNNSPDTLSEIVFKLYPNFYKKGSPRLRSTDPADLSDGVAIESISVDDAVIPVKNYRVDASNMFLRINPLAPGKQASFNISYSYVLNKTSHMRTGEVEPGAYFIAYFFPRIAVYDDIDGWNRFPYLGTQEFYNDFCDFSIAVTVPAGYTVWGTGDLANAGTLLKDKYLDRLRKAETGDGLINIIDSNDLKYDQPVKGDSKFNTWIFESKNVTDAVIALSNHYLWQGSSLVVDPKTGRRVRVDAVFNPVHKDYFHVQGDAWKTVEAMSYRFPKWPYPFSHMTVFDGLDQMEYPMMANDNPLENRVESIELTVHEIFHSIFPFYMGTNETKYGWMDEGWATIGEWLISPMIDSNIINEYGMARYQNAAGTETDMPVTSLTTMLNGNAMFINSYPKPALGYLYVKDMLGDELFFKALHQYIRNWNGKHPIPQDFFNSMNAGAGINMDWFWKRWFFDTGVPDLGIAGISGKGAAKQVKVVLKGDKPLPVDLEVSYADGSKEKIHRSIAVWQNGNRSITVKMNSGKKIRQLKLGSTYVPDVDRKDNLLEVN